MCDAKIHHSSSHRSNNRVVVNPCGWSELWTLFYYEKNIFHSWFQFFLSLFFCFFFSLKLSFCLTLTRSLAVRVTVYIISVEMLLSDGICAFSYTHVDVFASRRWFFFMNEYGADINKERGRLFLALSKCAAMSEMRCEKNFSLEGWDYCIWQRNDY